MIGHVGKPQALVERDGYGVERGIDDFRVERQQKSDFGAWWRPGFDFFGSAGEREGDESRVKTPDGWVDVCAEDVAGDDAAGDYAVVVFCNLGVPRGGLERHGAPAEYALYAVVVARP